MNEEWISVIEVGTQHGKKKGTIFKVLKRLGIKPELRRTASSKNQRVAYISPDDFY